MVRRTGWILCAVLALTVLPYCIAALAAGPDFVFGGFLLNPLDGNSYLAKMRQGWEGSWQFHLPFSVEQGDGSYLFLFYIFLGHAARFAGIPLVWMFHLARITATILLCLSLSKFIAQAVQEPASRTWALVLAVFGGGLGWLAFPFGGFTSDFWVAEGYPFLSAYANPHFPLTLAILCWLFTIPEYDRSVGRIMAVVLASALLALISPFGILLAAGILFIRWIWNPGKDRPQTWVPFAAVVGGGIPLLAYQYVTILNDPVLQLWNDQNQTPTPPLWDLAIALSPAILLALPGAWRAIRRKSVLDRTVIAWAAVSIFLMLLPIELQRRLMTGLFIPLSILAVGGIEIITHCSPTRFRRLALATTLLSVPTMGLVLAAGIFGGLSHDPSLGITTAEKQAFQWIEKNIPRQSVILASPVLGGFIPGWTGRRVVYGHPFETIRAEEKKELVEAFFQSNGSLDAYMNLKLEPADFILWGPREKAYGDVRELDGYWRIFEVGDVIIYSAKRAP